MAAYGGRCFKFLFEIPPYPFWAFVYEMEQELFLEVKFPNMTGGSDPESSAKAELPRSTQKKLVKTGAIHACSKISTLPNLP